MSRKSIGPVPNLTRYLPGALLLGFGIFALYQAWQLPLGTVREPSSGFYPALLCILLILCSSLILLDEIRKRADKPPAGTHAGHLRAWLIVFTIAAYVWALELLGFIICTALLLVILLRGFGGLRWVPTATAAVVGSILCYWVFVRLGLSLPAGVLTFPSLSGVGI